MTSASRGNTPVGLGIVGCGSVARAYADPIRRLQAEGRARAVACCDALPERAQEYAARYGVDCAVADFDALLALRGVDVILVFTPNTHHFPAATAALAAGKHVLVEKPMATSFTEARALAEQARVSPGHLVCAPFVILSRTFRVMAERISRGDIGTPCSARACYGWAGPDWASWFYQAGGGPLFDLGVYDVTAMTGLIGPAKRVTAMASICIPERVVQGQPVRVDAADNVHLVLDFGQGTLGSVVTGFTIQQQRGPALEIYGEEGVIQMLGHTWAPRGYELWQNSAGCWQVFEGVDHDYHWTAGLAHLVDCIITGAEPIVRPEHAAHVTEIIVRALESGEKGVALDLETSFKPVVFDAPESIRPGHRIHDPTRREEDEAGTDW
jgi:predicted dehydrogenase